MNWLQKLPGYRREPPGMEWKLLRRLPLVLLGGTVIPALVCVGTRLWPPQGTALEVARHLQRIDFAAIATVVTLWTAVLTVAIGCVVVVVMKGPAYVADRYELSDSDDPGDD